jgi:pilus assembly protein Flp/PilA
MRIGVMKTLIGFVNGLFRHEEGQTLTEYALIIALVSIAVIVVLGLLGGQIGAIFTSITGSLNV